MRLNLRFLLVLLCLVALADYSRAVEVTAGLHIGSHHFPDRDYFHGSNPGAYVQFDSVQVGAYRNSYGRTTAYLGYVQPVGPVDLMVGVASGYDKRCSTHTSVTVTKEVSPDGIRTATYRKTWEDCKGFSSHKLAPLAVVSYKLPEVSRVAPRVWLMPGLKDSSTAVGLSIETKF